ncbi:hypothetical protein CPB85DRAFT_1260755 [Mucidula mucida]|nr:hypothetical protein CPB85DRAFT_1260755 [Mucidula mucida]
MSPMPVFTGYMCHYSVLPLVWTNTMKTGYETCRRTKIQGVAGAAQWLATIDLSKITLDYHTNHALHVRNRDQEDDDEVLMGPLDLHECDANAQLLLESQLPAQRPITVLRRRNPYTQATVYEAAPPQDCGLERAVRDIPLPYRLADSMCSVLFRANTSGLIPAFEKCGILDAADFIQLQALLDAGELWQRILLRAVGLNREDVNYYRLLHLIGWPEDDTNGPSLDDSQNVWLETEDPVQLVPNTLDSRRTPPGPRDNKTALVGHCHIFWSTPRHKILTVNSEACKSHLAWWLAMPTPLFLNNSVIWLIESDSDESDSQYDTAPETFVEEDLTDEYPDPEVEGLIRAFRDSDMFKCPPVQSAQAQGTSSVGGGTLYAVSRSDGTQYSTTDWSQASTSVLNKGAIAKAIHKRYKRPRKVPGIYTTWHAARPSIHKVKGAIFIKCVQGGGWINVQLQLPTTTTFNLTGSASPLSDRLELRKWYCVYRGLTPGIYPLLLEAQLNVVGVKGASYESWTTLDEATRKFSAAQRRNEVQAVWHIPGLLYWLMEHNQFAHDFSYFGPSSIGRQD